MAMWNPWRGCHRCSEGWQTIQARQDLRSLFLTKRIDRFCIPDDICRPMLEAIELVAYLPGIKLVFRWICRSKITGAKTRRAFTALRVL